MPIRLSRQAIAGCLAGVALLVSLGAWYASAERRKQAVLDEISQALDEYRFSDAQSLLDEHDEATAELALLRSQLARRSHPADFEAAYTHLAEASRLGMDADRIEAERVRLACQQQGRSPTVERQLKAQADQNPALAAQVFETLVRGSLRTGQIGAALETLNQWLAQIPEDWRCGLWQGAVYEHMGQFELALREYQQVLEWNPEQPLAQERLGLVLARTGYNFQQAAELLAAKPDRPDADVLIARAICARALGQPDEARRLVEQALQSDPDHYRGRQLLALLLLKGESPEQALALIEQLEQQTNTLSPPEAIERLLALRPAVFEVYDTQAAGETLHLKARALQQLGRAEEAAACRVQLVRLQDTAAEIKQLMQTLQQRPDDRQLWFELGTLYARLGFHQDARLWFSRILEANPGDARAIEALRNLESNPP